MMGQILLSLAIFVPVAGSFFLPLAGKLSSRFRNILAFVLVSVSFIASAAMLPSALSGGQANYWQIELPLGLTFGFLGDGLAVFMAMVSSFIGAIIVLYSIGYMSHYNNQNEYYLLVVLFIGSMMGLVYSTNLIFLYVFWEIAAIVCWRLIGFFREKETVKRADKAFLVTVFGALVMLIGFFLIYQQTGTFDMLQMKGVQISDWAVALILVGIFAKSATLPLHTWLPDAGVAPSPVTSLLHAAVLVKIGVYAYARFFLVNFAMNPVWHIVVPIVVGLSAIVSAGAAIIEKDIKRLIAYSTVSQLGFIFLGLSTGSILGIAGGLLYILMHGLAKGGLFLCAGIVEQNAGTKDITKMGGLIKVMPVTAVTFIFCAFSVMGLPPFGGFFSKYLVISGAVSSEQAWIALAFIVGAILTIIYLLRAFTMVFMGETKLAGFEDIREGSRTMLVSVSVLAGLSLAAGILINYPSAFVQTIVQQMAVVIR
ncbi:MAG: NADH-quinone oxidoreductase subunit L [Bacillota bacterium]|nr:NADH-quinone oxidoreductase subunit L [Bacillota bacterium]